MTPQLTITIALGALAATLASGCAHPYRHIRAALDEGRAIEVVMVDTRVEYWRLDKHSDGLRPLPEAARTLAPIFAEELAKAWPSEAVQVAEKVGGSGAEITIQLDVTGEYHEATGVVSLNVWVRPIETASGSKLHVSYGHRLGGTSGKGASVEAAFANGYMRLSQETRLCAERFAKGVREAQ